MSSCRRLLLSILVQLLYHQTDALRHGYAPRWLLEMYCTGTTGIVAVPWNCEGYLYCTSPANTVDPKNLSGAWLECVDGLKFDKNKQACLRSSVICPVLKDVAAQLCPTNRFLKFPHPASCAMYYDCSQTNVLGQFNLGLYENECSYPMLFDDELGKCRYDQPYPVICSNKPTSKADYRKEGISLSPECAGKADGFYPNTGEPPFSPEYIDCVGGFKTHKRCNAGFAFNPYSRQCSSDLIDSVKSYCNGNPFAVFPDPLHCGRYYNCSLSTNTYMDAHEAVGVNPPQAECVYMYLYDVPQSTCVMYNQLTAPCGTRFEPISPCDYKVGHCVARNFCIPCEARCQGKVDGPHPYPTLPNTRFHMMCSGGRTKEVLRCFDGQIYSEEQKYCISIVSPTTPKPILTTEPPVDPRTEMCTCLDEVNSLVKSMQNISSVVDAMHMEMQVGSPYDCDEPPIIPQSIMKISYESDLAVARYTCADGYTSCAGQLISTCTRDNIWDRASIGDCLKSTWTDMNTVTLPCQPMIGSALLFKGRSVEDMFTISLLNKPNGDSYLLAKVTPTLGKVEASGITSMSPIPLTGETKWTIEFQTASFEIFVNGHFVMSVPNASALSLIRTLLLSDDFHPVEVQYYHSGNPLADDGKHPLNINLAQNKKASASSEYELSVSGRAVDGYSHVLWGEKSCWSAKASDSKPWWMVDLGKEFFVSHLVITSLDCQGSCGKSLKNFKIDVLEEDPRENMFARSEVCSTYGGTFPSRSIVRIDCGSHIVGRYVRIAVNAPVTDQMTICEVEVYGGLKRKTGWSPFSCPVPPIIKGASVQLSYTGFEAMATYTCEGSSVMCTGNSAIHCSNETGWDALPGSCTKTIHDAGIGQSVPDFPICRLNLGSGVELWVTPTENVGFLHLIHGTDKILQISLTLQTKDKPVALKHVVSGTSSQSVYPSQNPFRIGKESHVVIRALTDHLLIDVDGSVFYKYPVDLINIHRAVFIESSTGLNIRMAKIYPGFFHDVLRVPVKHNLALNADVESSSSYANPETYAVDGDPSQAWPSGSCWNADIGDTNQWYQVDLGKQHFIRKVNIYLRSNEQQKSQNLAFKKKAFGSQNFDLRSSHSNAVDGNHNDKRFSGSCFASHNSVKDPWWMVDLGKQYFISSVAIQKRGDGGYELQSSDLSVTVYDSNPGTDPNAQPSVCIKKAGPWGPFERVPCDSPVKGRFVMVKRTEGANSGIMTICEVQVFENVEIDNLALGKETTGSPNLDSHSSQDNVVDGNHNDKRLSDSCYTSSLSESDPWWMVNLGKTFTISSVAIQHRGDGYPDHHSDLAVVIYNSNPKTTANAQSTTCTQKSGPWGPFVKIPCTRPVKGQFVMIKRMDGGSSGVITICEVQVFEALESKLHDFTVNVHEENPASAVDAVSRRCVTHRGGFPKDERTTLTCAEDVWGRYLRIKADEVKDQYDQMTICEVEVYGDKAVKKEWSPEDCPAPPVQSNSFVSVALTPSQAVARYECFEDFATCNGRNTITCSGEAGWVGRPGSCQRNRFFAYDPAGLKTVHFCPLRLGEAVELHITPQSSGTFFFKDEGAFRQKIYDEGENCFFSKILTSRSMVLALNADSIEVLHMTWKTTPRRELLIKTELTTGEPFPKVLVQPVPLSVNKQSRVVITLLSSFLHIDIDGKIFYMKIKSAHLIDTVWTDKAALGKLNILEADDTQTLHVRSADNLAKLRPASASSEYQNYAKAGRASDGDVKTAWSSNSCWSTDGGDMDAWWMVDLQSLHYVSHVKITTRSDCGTTCSRRTHDFIIETFHRDPEPQDTGELCIKYDGVLPRSTTTTLHCIETVYGRILRISAPDRRDHKDLFTLCEVQVFGGMVVKTEGGARNLALFRPTSSSSMYDNVALPGRAVDGNKDFKYISGSCWLANTGDSNPWWQVQLDNYYFVTHVEISSRVECQPIGTCPKSVRDFVIEVFPRDSKLGLQSQLCLRHDGVFPHSTTKMLKCTNKALGRFVRIKSTDNNLFTLCEVSVFGEEVTFEDVTTTNLALDRPASSSSRLSPPGWAVDGNKNMAFSGSSCWSAESGEATSWWMVELDDYYLVTEVEITTRSDCAPCSQRVRNFEIETFNKDPTPADKGEICLVHKGVFPHGQTKKLQCTDKPVGRFVRLRAKERKPTQDLLTICEIEVFGAKINRSGWTPSDCPEPPLLPNACVDVCYNADHAVATYTCNTNYSMCTGSNVLYCNGKDGWEGTPSSCLQTTLEVHHGHVTDLSEFPICYPRLGEGLEMWITPQKSGGLLELVTDRIGSFAIQLKITPDLLSPVTLKSNDAGTEKTYQPDKKLFFIQMESNVVFLFLSGTLLIMVDGKILADIPHISSSAKIAYVRSSKDLSIRMVRPVNRYSEKIIRLQHDQNIAQGFPVTIPSGSGRQTLVDADYSTCWKPVDGEKNQWILIDLGKYYFIREVILYNGKKEACSSCDKRTRDFVINVYPMKNDDELMMTCAVYKGIMPPGATEKIRCKEDVWGRYLKISAAKEIIDKFDLMTFCEIEVYGDEMIKKPWTVFDCPNPALISDASVHMSYHRNKATATYTCDTDYSMCTGSNTLQCMSEDGWEGTLGTCQRTTFELPYGPDKDWKKLVICSPKLGEGLELWVFPVESSSKVSLKTGPTGDTILTLAITPDQANQRVTLSTVIGGTNGNELAITKDLFKLKMEAHVTILFLTDKITILVDGKFLAAYPHHGDTPLISYIESTANMNIRKFKPLPQYLDGIVRVTLDSNLALNKVTTAQSQFTNYNHANLVDGDLSQVGEKCWHSEIGEENQWVMIDLKDYYFIRELVLYARTTDCVNCATRTHDFAIDILPTKQEDKMSQRCAFYEGIMPQTAVERIRCHDDVWGRYVKISATKAKDALDLITFCEVEVYGDAVEDERYQVCPILNDPDNGQITVTGVKVNDMATLLCNADFKPCTDKLTGVCQENAEWETFATSCERYIWHSPTVPFEEQLPCGSWNRLLIKLKLTPTANTRCTMNVLEGSDVTLHWDIRFNFSGYNNKNIIDTKVNGNWGGIETMPSSFPFVVDQEASVEIDYHGGKYHLSADGSQLHTFTERKAGAKPQKIQVRNDCTVALLKVEHLNNGVE